MTNLGSGKIRAQTDSADGERGWREIRGVITAISDIVNKTVWPHSSAKWIFLVLETFLSRSFPGDHSGDLQAVN